MRTDNVTYEQIDEYEEKRAAVKANYSARLKSLSASDPECRRLLVERANALQTLAEAYRMPIGKEN